MPARTEQTDIPFLAPSVPGTTHLSAAVQIQSARLVPTSPGTPRPAWSTTMQASPSRPDVSSLTASDPAGSDTRQIRTDRLAPAMRDLAPRVTTHLIDGPDSCLVIARPPSPRPALNDGPESCLDSPVARHPQHPPVPVDGPGSSLLQPRPLLAYPHPTSLNLTCLRLSFTNQSPPCPTD